MNKNTETNNDLKKNSRLVLLRHGESEWNKENRFTGWTDVDLSEHGKEEVRAAGHLLNAHRFTFDVAFTSVLKRAIRSLWVVLDEMDLMWIPVYRDWRLNERHYGSLQGLNKAETTDKHGEDQVKLWRRSYNICPPALETNDQRHPIYDKKYTKLSADELPASESLKDTVARLLPYWKNTIEPLLHSGQSVLIVAHGNSLRALIKYLDNVSDEEIINVNIPTGIPLVYELDTEHHPIRHYYLKDTAAVEEAIEVFESQTSENH